MPDTDTVPFPRRALYTLAAAAVSAYQRRVYASPPVLADHPWKEPAVRDIEAALGEVGDAIGDSLDELVPPPCTSTRVIGDLTIACSVTLDGHLAHQGKAKDGSASVIVTWSEDPGDPWITRGTERMYL